MWRAARCLLVVGALFGAASGAVSGARAATTPDPVFDPLFDPEAAVARSEAAIGRGLGDYRFVDAAGAAVRLADYRGKPLVVSLVFTACSRSCPLIVERLAAAVEVAQDALGADAFSVITVGFDSANDTPARMRAFARAHGVDLPGWRFLSGDRASVDAMIEDLGFLRVSSPRGFDHIAQVSVVDADGRVRAQVYGDDFAAPALVEPLKALLLGQAIAVTDVAAVVRRVTLFCTFFDPRSGRYAVDYSFVIFLAVGGLSLLGLAVVLLRLVWARRRPLRTARTAQAGTPAGGKAAGGKAAGGVWGER